MKSKIIAFVCLITFLFSAIVPTTYAANKSLKFELQALGVFEGIDVESEGAFTRGEFSRVITNMLGFSSGTIDMGGGNWFSDIAGSPYAASINTLCALGIVNGDGYGRFNPDNGVQLTEAVKMLVNVLGYHVVLADESLDTYMVRAGLIGLLRGVSVGEGYPDRESMYVLLSNALDIGVLSDMSYVKGRPVLQKGDTYRSMLMNRMNYTVQELQGVVTADATVYQKLKVTDLHRNQLEIDGKIYRFEGIAPTGLVGISINFFQRVYDDGYQEVYAWELARQNTITEFKTADILDTKSNTLNTTAGNVKLSGSTRYLYNGRPDDGWDAAKLSALAHASFRAIDNNDDGTAEVVFIWKYQNRVVDRVNSDSRLVVLKAGAESTMAYINLDSEDEAYCTNILAADGTVTDFDTIQPGMVLSLAISRDGESITAVLCSDTAEGVLEEIGEGCLVIDGEAYDYDMDLSGVTVGKTVKLLLNFEGLAVDFDYDTEDMKSYAYVYGISTGSGIASNGKARLLLAGPVATRYTEVEDLATGGESTKTAELYARNEGAAVLDIASKVRVNGKSTPLEALSAKVLYKPVSYTLDAEGRIREFETLTAVDPEEPQKYYNANELIFGGNGTAAFGITQNRTRALCVPGVQNSQTGLFTVDPGADDDDLLVYTKLLSGSSVLYTVTGYEVDDSTHLADVIVITSSMMADAPNSVSSSSNVGMVASRKTVATDDGDLELKVSLIYGGEVLDYTVNELSPDSSKFATLSAGDLILFTIDGFNKLSDCMVLQPVNNYIDFVYDESTAYERFCGYVTKLDYNAASVKKNRWVHNYTVAFGDGSNELPYEVYARGSTPVFIIEKNNVVKSGSYDDVLYGCRVFFSVNSGNVRAIVVDKRGD